MAKATYKNISDGPRGGYLDGQLVVVGAGQEAELDDAPEEWFARAGSKAAKEAEKAAEGGEQAT